MSILAKLERKIDAVEQRHRAAQDNLQRIATEKRELEAAYRVLMQLFDEEAKAGDKGVGSGEELSRPKLVLKILDEAPSPLRPSEIREIAQKEHGRDIPSNSVHSALYHAKNTGRATNSGGTWSPVPANETAPGNGESPGATS